MRNRHPFLPGLTASAVVMLTALSIAPALASEPPPPPVFDSLSYIRHVTIGKLGCDTCSPRVCPNEPVRITVSGLLPDGCVAFRGLSELPLGAPFQAVAADFVVDTCGRACPTVLSPFTGSIELPPQPPGQHMVMLFESVRACPDTSVSAIMRSRTLVYEVLQNCPGEPPLDSLVRSLTSFRVVPERPCDGDSLTLQFFKRGCPPCVDLTGLWMTRARGLVASLDWRPLCVELACMPETLSMPLGRFAAGFHQLLVNTDVHVLGTPVPDSMIQYTTLVRFEVARSCDSTGTKCVFPFLGAAGAFPNCALAVPPGGRGELKLYARSSVPLGGIQGRLDCEPPFRIAGLRVPDGLSGLHLSWTPDNLGVRYLLFSDGADVIPVGQAPVLVALLVADSTARPGSRGGLVATIELASDPFGGGVPLCDMSTIRMAPIGLCVLADPANCDANADGRADVRDLVLMTRCFRHSLPHPDSLRVCRDCDGDGVFAFADLFCCAREILRRPLVPRDSVQSSDQVSVTMDAPMPFGNGLLVRVHVRGADALGAAMLRLRYPGDRWRADIPVTIDMRPEAATGWLPIVDCDDPGLVHLGGLRLQDDASSDIEFLVAFTPTSAPQPGDRIETEGADLASQDGRVLTPVAALPSAELKRSAPESPPAGVAELGPASPNPFGRSTHFVVSLPRESEVELTVHDLAGRRVATLAQGRLPAGRRDFSWDGANSRDGVYFVRLQVDGRVLSTRVALLRERR